MSRFATPYEALGRYPDRSRPLVTHYGGPSSRVELSVATAANSVAKAAGLLRDGLGLPPGATASVDLPLHWQLPIWVWACLSAGLGCGRRLPGPVDVRVVGPDGVARIAAGADPAADEVLACSCDAFGMALPGPLPVGVLDVVAARAHPDTFTPEPAARGAALLGQGAPRPWDAPDPAAGPLPIPPGARLWIDGATEQLLQRAAVVPLLVLGSVVLATDVDPGRAGQLRAAEGATLP